MLPIPVVSLEAPKPFVAIEKRRITMFTETIDKGHASHKGTRERHLLSLLMALIFALAIYPGKAHAQIIRALEANIPLQSHAGNTKLPAGNYPITILQHSHLT